MWPFFEKGHMRGHTKGHMPPQADLRETGENTSLADSESDAYGLSVRALRTDILH